MSVFPSQRFGSEVSMGTRAVRAVETHLQMLTTHKYAAAGA